MSPSIVHVVDDDQLIQRAMTRLLAAAGFETRTYTSALEFLSAIAPDASGCIILDVRLPDLNGLELQVALGSRGVSLPIIFLTGHGEIPDSVRAIQRGAVDFLITLLTLIAGTGEDSVFGYGFLPGILAARDLVGRYEYCHISCRGN